MFICLVAALVSLGGPEQGQQPKTFHSVRCGVAFDYPSSWIVVPNPEAGIKDPKDYQKLATCGFGLRPTSWVEEMKSDAIPLRVYPVRLVVWRRPFAQAARDSFFIRVSDFEVDGPPLSLSDLEPWDWGIVVRQGFAPATQFTTECCQGVRGTSWGHGQAKDGSKATLVWEGAVINNRRGRSVVLESDEAERFRDVVTQVLQSLRLTTPE